MTMRHVKSRVRTVEELGLPPVLATLAEAKRGIIIVCGTTGSGKSSTLAAMLDLGRGRGPMNHAFDLQGEFAKEA